MHSLKLLDCFVLSPLNPHVSSTVTLQQIICVSPFLLACNARTHNATVSIWVLFSFDQSMRKKCKMQINNNLYVDVSQTIASTPSLSLSLPLICPYFFQFSVTVWHICTHRTFNPLIVYDLNKFPDIVTYVLSGETCRLHSAYSAPCRIQQRWGLSTLFYMVYIIQYTVLSSVTCVVSIARNECPMVGLTSDHCDICFFFSFADAPILSSPPFLRIPSQLC